MKHFYSDKAKAFYIEDLRAAYEAAGTWPDDAIAITEEQYEALLEGLADATKVVKMDSKKRLKLGSRSTSELKDMNISQERLWRDGELTRADIELLKSEDGDGIGEPSDWRKYRVALRAWPSASKFPDKSFRPKAPDAAE